MHQYNYINKSHGVTEQNNCPLALTAQVLHSNSGASSKALFWPCPSAPVQEVTHKVRNPSDLSHGLTAHRDHGMQA